MKNIFSLNFMILLVLMGGCRATDTSSNRTNTLNNMDYNKLWSSVDSLDNKGLVKSAAKIVDKIYRAAKADEQAQDHYIKSVIYKGKYLWHESDEAYAEETDLWKSEIEEADFPAKNVMSSILAELYQDYHNKNYWKLKDRTAFDDEGEDMALWSSDRLLRESDYWYNQSVNRSEELAELSVSRYDLILTPEDYSEELRPTLADFLIHRYIDFLKVKYQRYDVVTSVDHLTEKKLFLPTTEFIEASLTFDLESVSNVTEAYQFLLAHHTSQSNTEALVHLDLERLSWALDLSQLSGKEDYYVDALDKLYASLAGKKESSEVLARKASYIYSQVRTDRADAEENSYVEALNICRQAQKDYPQSRGAHMAYNLEQRILKPSLELRMESVVLPDESIPFLLKYKNLSQVNLRLVKLSEEEFLHMSIDRAQDTYNQLKGIKENTEWSLSIPDPKDYRAHQVESRVAPLDFGFYALMYSAVDDDDQSLNGYKLIQCTRIAYWTGGSPGMEKIDIQVVDRLTGEPLQDVDLMTYRQVYRRYIPQEEFFSGQTDNNGIVAVPAGQAYRPRFQKGKDIFHVQELVNSRYYGNRDNGIRQRSYFFTDRAIYRPGQQVHFKVLSMELSAEDMPKPLKQYDHTVTLRDPNGEVVSSKKMRSSDYGSASSSFTIPSGRLQGRYTLSIGQTNSSHAIQVESYKRPSHEVILDSLEGEYLVNDLVDVQGSALSFSGFPISNAAVNYRIYRSVFYPYPVWPFRYDSRRPQEESLLEAGKTKTDKEGRFSFQFKAVPDKGSSARHQPVFDYRVEIEVTDITGETQEQSRNYKIGYMSVKADWQVPEIISSDALEDVLIKFTNLDGRPIEADVDLVVEKLRSPDRYLQKRRWVTPDQHIHSREQWKTWFPYLPYQEEDRVENWEVQQVIDQVEKSETPDFLLPLSEIDLAAGTYRLRLTAKGDKGEAYRETRVLKVISQEKDEVYSDILFQLTDNPKMKPRQSYKWRLRSSAPVYAFLYRGEDRELERMSSVQISGSYDKMVAVDRYGGLTLFAVGYYRNRFFKLSQNIHAPYTHKELKIELETFRPILEPGVAEEYTVRIMDYKSKGVRAELLASMYDQSLDEFIPHRWSAPSVFATHYYNGYGGLRSSQNALFSKIISSGLLDNKHVEPQILYKLNWFNRYRGQFARRRSGDVVFETADMSAPMSRPEMDVEARSDQAEGSPNEMQAKSSNQDPIRTDFAETVFWYPDIRTDEEGNASFKFKMKDALTRWKLQLFYHTEDLAMGYTEKTLQTQKELSVQILPPRILRQGDEILIPTKLVNMSEESQSTHLQVQLFDEYGEEVTSSLLSSPEARQLVLKPGASTNEYWSISIPDDYIGAVMIRAKAKGPRHSDGEERLIPVLTNRVLVTESLPLAVRPGEERNFAFDSYASKISDPSLLHHKLSVEFSSNPAWYAVQALSYLADYPHECSEQVFSRFYANALARHVVESNPAIEKVFKDWQSKGELASPLQKNEELKTVLLEETPWLHDAKNQQEQMSRIALLMDFNHMQQRAQEELSALINSQNVDGSWPWFKGGRPNPTVTLHIVEFWSHLESLGVLTADQKQQFAPAIQKAQAFLNTNLEKDYNKLVEKLKKQSKNDEVDLDKLLNKNNLSYFALHYLYARSKAAEWQSSESLEPALKYYRNQVTKYWAEASLHQQGMMAFVLDDIGEESEYRTLLESLRQRSTTSPELGMYWIQSSAYGWYQRPIETHALMIELFNHAGDTDAVNELKMWLLKNKQTNHWETTKATAWAIYALLLSGEDWLMERELVSVMVGDRDASASADKSTGSLYYKTELPVDEVKSDLDKISVHNTNDVPAWGAMYWQYFQDIDKVEGFKETPLQIQKDLFLKKVIDSKERLEKISSNTELRPGDELVVRIEVEVDREMEFIHMKDYRAAGLEPVSVISRYKWQGGLGYYESTKDAATHFFIDYLAPGKYVFEYSLRVVHPGDFSNGFCSMESMYAPEFRSHSKGLKLHIAEPQ